MARLTDEVQRNIVSFIRAGGFAHVAAEAAGVRREEFDAWMTRPGPRYRAFAQAVTQAEGQVRLRAEINVLDAKPLDWLKSGPGKPKPGAPGWTAPARAAVTQEERSGMADPVFQRLVSFLLGELESSPELKARLAQGLDSFS